MSYRTQTARSISLAIVLAVLGASCAATPSAQQQPSTATASPRAGASASSTASPTAPPSPSSSFAPSASASPSSSAAASASPGEFPPTPSPVASGPFAGYIFVPSATGSPPQDFARYGGTVVDSSTGDPVAGACVYTGPPAGCPPKGALQTDEHGGFAIDLPSGSDWAFTVEIPTYQPAVQLLLDRRTDNAVRLMHR